MSRRVWGLFLLLLLKIQNRWLVSGRCIQPLLCKAKLSVLARRLWLCVLGFLFAWFFSFFSSWSVLEIPCKEIILD